MRTSIFTALGLGACLLAVTPAAAEDDWIAGIEKKLEQKISLEIKDSTVSSALTLFQKSSGVTVTLDPAAAKAVKSVKIDFSAKDMTGAHALGNILRLSGLRYTFADGAVHVSSTRQVAQKLVESSAKVTEEAVESKPMTNGDAAVIRMNSTYYQEEHYGIGITGEGTRFTQKWQKPYLDPVTGLTQYPGPPIISESESAGGRGVWFTQQPYYIKPQYRGLVPQSLSDRVVVQEVVHKNSGDDTASQILKILAENPDLTGKEILEKIKGAK